MIEAVFGILGNSTALLADAAHNLSDVLGLLVAWTAVGLSRRKPSDRFTYGLRGSSILAALFNAMFSKVASQPIWFNNFTFHNIYFVFFELSATKLALYNTFVLGLSTATIGTVIAVAGARGFGSAPKARAQLIWSLSPLTFPHELARVLVAEQLYRAVTILRGVPYHK